MSGLGDRFPVSTGVNSTLQTPFPSVVRARPCRRGSAAVSGGGQPGCMTGEAEKCCRGNWNGQNTIAYI